MIQLLGSFVWNTFTVVLVRDKLKLDLRITSLVVGDCIVSVYLQLSMRLDLGLVAVLKTPHAAIQFLSNIHCFINQSTFFVNVSLYNLAIKLSCWSHIHIHGVTEKLIMLVLKMLKHEKASQSGRCLPVVGWEGYWEALVAIYWEGCLLVLFSGRLLIVM